MLKNILNIIKCQLLTEISSIANIKNGVKQQYLSQLLLIDQRLENLCVRIVRKQ